MTNLEAAARPRPAVRTLPPRAGQPRAGQPHSAPARALTGLDGVPRAAAGYRILRAWQRALDVAAHAHELALRLSDGTHATLGAELLRAAMTVPAQIAAGNLAYDRTEHRRALVAAQTALAHVETLALLAERLALVPPLSVAALLADSADTLRLVRALARVVAPVVSEEPVTCAPTPR